MIDWLFSDRTTGRPTVAQWPNLPLVAFVVAAVVRAVLHPSGTVGTVVDVVATVALVAWAGDEVLRGVDPWRRLLGGGVLAVTVGAS